MRPARGKSSNNDEQLTSRGEQSLLTPEEVSRKLRVTAEQVRNLIRQGRISAINVGSGKKRPLYRIKKQAIEDFINAQSPQKQPSKNRKFRRPPPVQDFFPELK